MPPLAIAGVGLAVGGAGAALGAKSAKKAAKKAAAVQLQTTQENNALARDIYGQNKGVLSPYIGRGDVAGGTINAFAGLGGDLAGAQNAFKQYIGNSDYGFQFGEGANALNSGYAGRGLLQSGAAMKGLEGYRQGLQSGYRNEFLNLLGNQQGVGLSAGSALAGVGQNYVNTVGANNQANATAQGNAALIKGQNNPLANALGVVGGGLFGYGG